MALTRRAVADVLLPGAGLLALALFAILYVFDRDLYASLIDLWAARPQATPFFDIDTPLAWIRGARQGQDIYRDLIAGAHGWKMQYSPLLTLWPLPSVAPESAAAYGIIVDVLFIGSLALLPRARVALDTLPMLAALFSPLCMFALERGNLDLLIFSMAAVGLLCLGHRLTVRLVGYAAILAAGLTKFYPFVLLILVARDRAAVFLALSTAFVLILIAFFVGYHEELGLIQANMPFPVPFIDTFGSKQVATGLVLITHPLRAGVAPYDQIDAGIWVVTMLVLCGATLVFGWRLARSAALRHALVRLSEREALFLSGGAALACGCFFAGTSVGYRAVHLLFALPGLLALARVTDDPRFARRCRVVVTAILLVMWALPVQRAIDDTFGPYWIIGVGLDSHSPAALIAGAGFWLVREAAWWWLMTFLFAVVVRTILASRAVQETLQWLSGQQPAQAGTS